MDTDGDIYRLQKSTIIAQIFDKFVFWVGHVPGLVNKLCNGPGTEFMCSPYHLFSFWYCKVDIYIYIYI